MSRSWRSPALALASAVAVALLTMTGAPREASAIITNITATPNPVNNPNTALIQVTANETDAVSGGGPIYLTVGAGAITSVTTCVVQVVTACVLPDYLGLGTGAVTVQSATNNDLAQGQSLTVTFIYSPPTVTTPTLVPVSACQGLLCTPFSFGSIIVNPSTVSSTVTQIQLSVSPTLVACGGTITVTATAGTEGVVAPDGTPIAFSSSLGGSVVATTSGGTVTVTMVVPLGFQGAFTVIAASGAAVAQTSVDVFCEVAGPPAQLALTLAPTSLACGNTATVLARVTDRFGRAVSDGTIVTFSTTLGTIVPTAPTIGGLATAVLTSVQGRPGTAQVTARAGDVSTQAALPVVCAAPPTAVPPPAAPAPTPTAAPPPPSLPPPSPPSAITPPSTGDGGLAAR